MGSEEPEFITYDIMKLPVELQKEIGTYLSPEDLAQLSQLSKEHYILARTMERKKDKENRLKHEMRDKRMCIALLKNKKGYCTRYKSQDSDYCLQHKRIYERDRK